MPRGPCHLRRPTMYGYRMSFMNNLSLRSFLLACALFGLGSAPVLAVAQSDKTPPPASEKEKPADKSAPEKPGLPPLPPPAHSQQSIQLDGKTLKYTVTVGALPVRDSDGKEAGEVVVTAYTVDGDNRPVTFALNGGPG